VSRVVLPPVSESPGAEHVTALEVSALDRAFARMLVRRVAPARQAALETPRDMPHDAQRETRALDPLLWHTALLVSAERAQGHSCLDLSVYAAHTITEDAALPPFTLPALDEWRARLRLSGACEETSAASAIDRADALERSPLVLDGSRLYLARFFDAEVRVAACVRTRVASPVAARNPSPLFLALFPDGTTDGQAEAARAALRSPLVFITGGPGTGKTTIAAKLLALLLEQQPTLRIALAAPTGRAAARLGESMNAAIAREALPPSVAERLPRTGVTLHRLLGYRPSNDHFSYTCHHPLADDVIVVDEASMVDVLMMDALLAAAKPDARLIVLGDPDQLASVDTGFVLGDVVRAAAEPASVMAGAVVSLTHSYRFGARPGIGVIAQAAQRGSGEALLAALTSGTHDELSYVARAERASVLLAPIAPQIERYLAAGTPTAALEALGAFRLLCALREGETGVDGLNRTVERWLRGRGVSTGGWYAHRPVLITQNDPATELFNGDVGTTMLTGGEPLVYFPGPRGVRAITPARLPAHETAWAMTVHKAQGSEFDHVVLVLPEADSRVLTRELLYTGITRAKQRVTIVGSEALLRSTVARSVVRSSGLVERLVGR
jgi:exodeoxyribonuclease V alpha subunit